ncbi:unnamed protein product [Auanema sp. JU1783]|nr:unnamed protein product [Auanema sp. JU1783]
MDSLPSSAYSDHAAIEPDFAFNNSNLDQEDDTTPAEVLSEMKVSWQNEVASPILLPHRFDAAECLIDQIDGIEENLARQSDKTAPWIAIHRMEQQRLTYIVNDYIRVRLAKIEQNPRWLLKEHERRIQMYNPSVEEHPVELLAPQELEFAKRYAESEGILLGNTFLGRLPPALRKIAVSELDTEFDRVFAEVMVDDVEQVVVPDYQDPTSDVLVGLEKDSVHLIAFNSVQNQIERGQVRLL